MPNPFPNTTYPTNYDEDDFLKSGAAEVNEGGAAGTAEIQSAFNDATGGDFTFDFDGQVTADVPFDVGNDAAVAAAVVLTIDAIPVDNDVVTINGRVYKFETTLADDDDIAIGGSEAQAKLNLVAAMDLSGTEGVDYQVPTANADVAMAAFAGDDADVTALIAGLAGNAITSTASLSGTGDFAAATLLLGLDSVESALEALSNVVDVAVTGLGTAGSPWLITFVDPEGDVAQLVADDTGLTGQTLGTVIANVTSGSDPLTVSDVAAGQGPL